MTMEARAWRYLRRHPGCTMPQVSASAPHLDLRNAVRRLVAKGYAKSVGNTRTMRYWAVGNSAPDDERGHCGKSHLGRARCPNGRRVRLEQLHPLQQVWR